MNLPILPTTMVGSYSMPGWLERLKTEYFARRISRVELDEIHDTAVKAAIKDQEIAGLDIVTDGELRRDNMIDYFVERLPGVQVDRSSKKFYYDFYDSEVMGKIPMAALGLVDDFRFLLANTDRETKICITGPHSLTKRIRNKHYPSEEALATDIARVMNMELKELVKAGVGCSILTSIAIRNEVACGELVAEAITRPSIRSTVAITTLRETPLSRFATEWIAMLRGKLTRFVGSEQWKEDIVWLDKDVASQPH